MGERYHTRSYLRLSYWIAKLQVLLDVFYVRDETILHFIFILCAGVGYDILVNMLKYIAPTHVVKINISAKSKNLPDGVFWLDGSNEEMGNLIEISSAREDSFKRS